MWIIAPLGKPVLQVKLFRRILDRDNLDGVDTEGPARTIYTTERIEQQMRAESPPPQARVHGEPAQERHWNRVFGQGLALLL